MFGHTAKASGYSLRINTHLHQLPKTNTGSLTKSTLLLKCRHLLCDRQRRRHRGGAGFSRC